MLFLTYFLILVRNGEIAPARARELTQDDIHTLQRYRKVLTGMWWLGAAMVMMAVPAMDYPWFSYVFFGGLLGVAFLTGALAAPVHSLSRHATACQDILDACVLSANAESYRKSIVGHRELIQMDAMIMHRMVRDDALDATRHEHEQACRKAHGLL